MVVGVSKTDDIQRANEDSQRSRKRGTKNLRRSETATSELNEQGLSDFSNDEAADTAEMRKFQRKLATKFAEHGDQRVFDVELDDVLTESPSDDYDDDGDANVRPKKRSRVSGPTRGKTKTPRPKRKPRKSPAKISALMMVEGELDAETVAAALAAGVDISDEVRATREATHCE